MKVCSMSTVIHIVIAVFLCKIYQLDGFLHTGEQQEQQDHQQQQSEWQQRILDNINNNNNNIINPHDEPSVMPSIAPSLYPTYKPSTTPTVLSSSIPTVSPSFEPSVEIDLVDDEEEQESTTLPAIICESYELGLETQQLACPLTYKIVTTFVGHALNKYTYEKEYIEPTVTSSYPDTVRGNTTLPLFGDCQSGCFNDDECAPELWCAYTHRNDLQTIDDTILDTYCSGTWNDNVCFQKELLDPVERRILLQQDSVAFDFVTVNEDNYHRQLGCGKCSPYCRWRPNAPACIVLNCDDCRRRRRSRNRNRSLSSQTQPTIVNAQALATLATSKLRELSTWENITSIDPNCTVFLRTATCIPDREDWMSASTRPSSYPTDLPSSSPEAATTTASITPTLLPSMSPSIATVSPEPTITSVPTLVVSSIVPTLTMSPSQSPLPTVLPLQYPEHTLSPNPTITNIPTLAVSSMVPTLTMSPSPSPLPTVLPLQYPEHTLSPEPTITSIPTLAVSSIVPTLTLSPSPSPLPTVLPLQYPEYTLSPEPTITSIPTLAVSSIVPTLTLSPSPSPLPTVLPLQYPEYTLSPKPTETSTPTSVSSIVPTSMPSVEPTVEIALDEEESSHLPAIICESFELGLESQQLACPQTYEIVTTVVGHALNKYTYDKDYIDPTETSAYPDTVRGDMILPLFGECQSGCLKDDECAPKLLCAFTHREELQTIDVDVRDAYCGSWDDKVCFRKELLDPLEGRLLLDNVAFDFVNVNEYRYHRQLGCGKCSPYCRWRPNAPACIVLNCDDCRRRRRSRSLSQAKPKVNALALARLATSKLRELSTWENITSVDPSCAVFLQTAKCIPEPEDWMTLSAPPSSYPTVIPSSIPTVYPIVSLSSSPTSYPTVFPSSSPSADPTVHGSFMPTTDPSLSPSFYPTTSKLSLAPTELLSKFPTSRPTITPTYQIIPTIDLPTIPPPDNVLELPGIKCESFSVQPVPLQLACPNAYKLISIHVGHDLNLFSYQNNWIASTETSMYPDSIKDQIVMPLLGECRWDCNLDSDCAPGLLCAEQYEVQIKALNLSRYKVRCNRYRSGPPRSHVCFRRQVLTRSSFRLLRGDSDMEHRRELSCSWECSSVCKNSNAPACLALDCRNNCRRRRTNEFEQTLTIDEERSLQTSIDVSALLMLATTRLRELASWQNITSMDDASCTNFLQTATCSVDDDSSATNVPSRKPTQTPSKSPSKKPSTHPSMSPSNVPVSVASNDSTHEPNVHPSTAPSEQPNRFYSLFQSSKPTERPSSRPVTTPIETGIQPIPPTLLRGVYFVNTANHTTYETTVPSLGTGHNTYYQSELGEHLSLEVILFPNSTIVSNVTSVTFSYDGITDRELYSRYCMGGDNKTPYCSPVLYLRTTGNKSVVVTVDALDNDNMPVKYQTTFNFMIV